METETASNLQGIEGYLQYPFETDDEYQQGLASLIDSGMIDTNSPEEIKREMMMRTQVFYYNKITGSSISMDEARDAERQRTQSTTPATSSTTATANAENDETRVLSFAELKELIETGNVDKIPNNKIIPDALNESAPSQSTAPIRRKPWEKETTESQPA